MLGKRAKIISISVIALLFILVIITTAAAKKDKDSDDEDLPVYIVDLNTTLTNEMCDSLGLEGLDKRVKEYMTVWGLHGVSLSVMRNDSLLFSKGYGEADENVPMTPGKILRVASVSKLVTAAGIMKMQDDGLLTLQDKVFGPQGILNDSLYTAAIKDTNYYKITVEHLLRHQGGFSRRGGDPMFSTRWLMMQNHWTEVPTHEQLMVIQLKRRLSFVPGTSQYYSNFGYLVLSMIIEKLSGKAYEDYIQENILRPAGCRNFKIAGNYYSDKYPDEVRYYVYKDDEPADEFNNSGRKVERCYGGNDVTGLSGAGAWVASSPELALFVASIDGKPEISDVISEESVKQMTEYIDKDTYSLGWNDTNPEKGWTRTGTLSGTSAYIKYYPDGECWIFITNTSTWRGPGLAHYTDGLFDKLRASYSSKLPARDLFYKK
jgi:CubicO group peptidase (beta-lactamase class C family)